VIEEWGKASDDATCIVVNCTREGGSWERSMI
jgi:hypothetical protein